MPVARACVGLDVGIAIYMQKPVHVHGTWIGTNMGTEPSDMVELLNVKVKNRLQRVELLEGGISGILRTAQN